MLFLIDITVPIPPQVNAQEVARLKTLERAEAERLQRAGKLRHLWRVAGQQRNISIYDVADNQELHDILSNLPLFLYMKVTVTALSDHPSALPKTGV